MSLPPLPPVLFVINYMDDSYTAEQMKAYGQQCRDAALEEAKQAAYDWVQYHCDFTKADEIADEIRRLKP